MTLEMVDPHVHLRIVATMERIMLHINKGNNDSSKSNHNDLRDLAKTMEGPQKTKVLVPKRWRVPKKTKNHKVLVRSDMLGQALLLQGDGSVRPTWEAWADQPADFGCPAERRR